MPPTIRRGVERILAIVSPSGLAFREATRWETGFDDDDDDDDDGFVEVVR